MEGSLLDIKLPGRFHQPYSPNWGRKLNFTPEMPFRRIRMKYVASVALALFSVAAIGEEEYSESLLQGLQGVGLEVRPLHVRSNHFDLDEAILEQHVMAQLDELQVRVFSEGELEVLPGRPYLELGVNVAHAQGPSHLYSVTLKLREMAALERPKNTSVSMALSTWERESMGIANRQEAILETVDRMIRIFSQELHSINVEE